MQSPEFPQYKFITPRSFTIGRHAGQPTVFVIHTTDGSEGRTSAENGAAYDIRRVDGTSTHFFVDTDSVIQCVRTTDEAHAARTHGNDVGIQIEVCGRANQTAIQWADEASEGTLEQLVHLIVALRKKYSFPLVNLTPAQLRTGSKGFAEHYDFTRAFPEDKGDHTDPGPNFPWSKMFARVREIETLGVDKMPLPKKNDSGEDVKYWQFVHNSVRNTFTPPMATLKVDGEYGDSTEAAFTDFWKRSGGQVTFKATYMPGWLAHKYHIALAKVSVPKPEVINQEELQASVKKLVDAWLLEHVGTEFAITGDLKGKVSML